MEIYEIKKAFTELSTKFDSLVEKVNLEDLNQKLGVINEEVNAPNFWDNPQVAAKKTKQQQSLQSLIDTTTEIKTQIEEFNFAIEMFELEELDLEELNDEFSNLQSAFQNFEIKILLSGEYDDNNAILEIHPGAGGTESQDWANMLYDMYMKFFKANNYKANVLDYQVADVAGIKSVTIEVSGDKAYGMMRGENGIHRLVRISPFDSSAKRHTSFASVKVMPVIENNDEIEINDSDLKIDVYRSSGAGGQSVNTTDSAVRITHLPTKTVVTCQNERSQIQNREQAMKILMAKLTEIKLQEQAEEKARLAGTQLSNGWGSQKRSYVLHPYKMVKDHNTNFESSQAEKVLAGDLNEFLYHNLLEE